MKRQTPRTWSWKSATKIALVLSSLALAHGCAVTSEYTLAAEAQTAEATPMSSEEIALKYLNEAFRDEVVYDAIVSENYILHFAGEEFAVTGREAVKEWNEAELFSGLPDVTQTVEFLVVDGPLVAARVRYQGTHTGLFAGLEPTGRTINVPANMILRIEEGRVVEEWTESNQLAWLAQLTEE